MRVLVVDYEYPPLGGGGGVLTQALVRPLAKKHDVVVLTSRALGLAAESQEDGARIIRAAVPGRTDKNSASNLSLMAFPAVGIAAGMKLLRSWKPDVVHTFFAVPSGPAGWALAKAARAPHVLTVIGADIHDPTRTLSPDRSKAVGAVARRMIRDADLVAAIASDIRTRAIGLSGRSDIGLVHGAVPDGGPLPAPDRAGLGWAEHECVVLVCARLVPRKGHDILLRALRNAPHNVRVEIVGDGPERARLEQLAAALPHTVTFTGEISLEERDRRLASADAFALPSLHEGFPLALLEALRAGLPVVASDSGGQRDMFADGEGGFLVRVGDEDAIARHLTTFAEDVERRKQMGKAARAGVEIFTDEYMTARYVELYEDALAGRKR
jgi:glycosyltransferase involved in cell wall biosynthesis